MNVEKRNRENECYMLLFIKFQSLKAERSSKDENPFEFESNNAVKVWNARCKLIVFVLQFVFV